HVTRRAMTGSMLAFRWRYSDEGSEDSVSNAARRAGAQWLSSAAIHFRCISSDNIHGVDSGGNRLFCHHCAVYSGTRDPRTPYTLEARLHAGVPPRRCAGRSRFLYRSLGLCVLSIPAGAKAGGSSPLKSGGLSGLTVDFSHAARDSNG